MRRVDKRTFLVGVECPTKGWLAAREESGSGGFGDQWRTWVGIEVERLAKPWLGAGQVLPRTPIEQAAELTQAALSAPDAARLFEATFCTPTLVARADALERVPDGWRLLEIKSGKAKNDEAVKKEYVADIAYTLMVARRAGCAVRGAELVLINPEYRLGGAEPMFARVDVTAEATAQAVEFERVADALAAAVLAEERPPATLNFACRKCDFYGTTCIDQDVPDPLWILQRLSEKKFEVMRPFGRLSQVPEDVELTPIQRRVFDVARAGVPRHDAAALTKLLARVVWPVAYLDFEAVMPAIPWFADSEAHEAIPFQYSLHVIDRPGGETRHHEYLAPLDTDWRRELLDRLFADLGRSGSVMVYSSYERTRLKALAVSFPEYQSAIDAVIARMFDLEQVFKDAYWHPGFRGRTSIKKVLPVMVREEGLSYDVLPVNNGDDALGLFGLMRVGEVEEAAVERHREELLRYCGLDTLAMVRLHAAVAALL